MSTVLRANLGNQTNDPIRGRGSVCSISAPGFLPAVLWSWNDYLTPEELVAQLREFPACGIGGVFMHVRTGLLIEYFGDDWIHCVQRVLEEGERLGMEIHLYDEDRWPSGYGAGMVARRDPRFSLCVAYALPEGSAPYPGSTWLVNGPGFSVYSYRAPLGDERYNGSAYIDTMNPEAVRAFIAAGYEAYFEKFSEYFGTTILAEFTDEASPIDWRTALPAGSVPYSPQLRDAFQRWHGEDFQEHLPKLFVDAAGAAEFRVKYYRAVDRLFEENFTRQISDWCESRRIALTGHYMAEDSLLKQQLWASNPVRNSRWMGLPGIDHLGCQVAEVLTGKQCQSAVNQQGKRRMLSEVFGASGYGLSFFDRQWIGGQQIALGVNFFCHHLTHYSLRGHRKRDYPPTFSYQQPWWKLNRLIDLPLSRVCQFMAEGKYAADLLVLIPQDAIRMRAATKIGDPSHPLAPGLPSGHFSRLPELKKVSEEFDGLCRRLLALQLQFDLSDPVTLENDACVTTAEDGLDAAIQVGEMNYRAVLLPKGYPLTEKQYTLLSKFGALGGSIIREAAVELCPALPVGRKREMRAWCESLPEFQAFEDGGFRTLSAMARFFPAGSDCAASDALVHVRKLEDGRLRMFLANLSNRRDLTGTLVVQRSCCGVLSVDPFSQRTERMKTQGDGCTRVPVSLAPGGWGVYELHSEELPGACPSEGLRHRLLAGPQEERFVDFYETEWTSVNVLPLDMVRFRLKESEAWSQAVPVIALKQWLDLRKYQGPLWLQYAFRASGSLDGLELVSEFEPGVPMKWNGVDLNTDPSRWWIDRHWHPRVPKVTPRCGENHVECFISYIPANPGETKSLPARYGTELEAIYVTGDFTVQGSYVEEDRYGARWKDWGEPLGQLLYLGADQVVLGPPPRGASQWRYADSISGGRPFYAGSVIHRAVVPCKMFPQGKAVLSCGHCGGVVTEVRINSQVAGHLWRPPFELDISDYIQAGRDLHMEFEVFGSLRNLLGPHHHHEGEPLAVGPEHFLWEAQRGAAFDDELKNWIENAVKPVLWRPNYCVARFGSLGNVVIRTQKEER